MDPWPLRVGHRPLFLGGSQWVSSHKALRHVMTVWPGTGPAALCSVSLPRDRAGRWHCAAGAREEQCARDGSAAEPRTPGVPLAHMVRPRVGSAGSSGVRSLRLRLTRGQCATLLRGKPAPRVSEDLTLAAVHLHVPACSAARGLGLAPWAVPREHASGAATLCPSDLAPSLSLLDQFPDLKLACSDDRKNESGDAAYDATCPPSPASVCDPCSFLPPALETGQRGLPVTAPSLPRHHQLGRLSHNEPAGSTERGGRALR